MTLDIVEETDGDSFRLTTTWRGEPVSAESDGFEEALLRLVEALPSGRIPVMCGLCRLGAVDPFSASQGRDDISCFRDAQHLIDAYERQGRHAPPEFFQYLGKEPVHAFHSCGQFEPKKLSRDESV